MRKTLLAAGIAAAALLPTFALAQQTCEQSNNNRIAGTVIGAGLGAILGSQVAGHGAKTEGSVIGAIGGGVLGNQIAKSRSNCTSANAYGYYDANGAWHANSVDRASAAGYYDRDGRWVDGAPSGYYDSQNRWIAANTNASASGYYDANGHYVPASASGYYDANGQWVGASSSGYYNANGRWVAGPATGRYDANGRWISGQPAGHRAANGMWVADAQPGYYNSNGRWVAGTATGYYDGQGRWIATAPSASGYGQNASYQAGSGWAGAPMDIRGRQAWLQQRVQRGLNDGSLSRAEADNAMRQLNMISRQERGMRHYRNGRLGARDTATIQARLDHVAADIRSDRRDGDSIPHN